MPTKKIKAKPRKKQSRDPKKTRRKAGQTAQRKAKQSASKTVRATTKKTARSTPPPSLFKNAKKGFPIVGIGASAGGLEALEGLFSRMPLDATMAFVIIQHLDPKHKSIMGTLLRKHTKMKIVEIEDGVRVEPNCVYLRPPNKDVTIINRTLQLMDPQEGHGARLTIDSFFRSLSEDQGEKAICIILSGTGTDGTLGLKAIKGEGGMTMVQEEKQAKYDGMPRSAIDTGLVDYILPVEEMPQELIKYVRHPYIDGTTKAPVLEERFENYAQKIFVLIRAQTGHDFSDYKQTTLRRRIERRMAVHQITRISDYVRYLQQKPAEVEVLFKDLLITVTSFFRDPECYEVVRKTVIPELLKERDDKAVTSLRVWVPGCSSGEEAYSLAILLAEAMVERRGRLDLQIFATDIDQHAIECARQGVYPGSIAADVSPQRLKQFFLKEDNTYQVSKRIREMIVFATQSLIKDPPFSKLDMIVCRNVLIYMNQALQKRIVPLFHYTLKQNRFLVLGPSESIGGFTDLFSPVDPKWKIFKREERILERAAHYPGVVLAGPEPEPQREGKEKVLKGGDIRALAEKVILESYALPCVLVNEKYDILYFHGKNDRYLSPPIGEASFNILKMAHEDLRHKLSTSLRKAVRERKTVVVEGLKIRHNGQLATIDLVVRPLVEAAIGQGLLMVVFEERTGSTMITKKTQGVRQAKRADPHIESLEQELQSTKEYLQTTIEELETANEELKSTNEELQSTNEELQSTNEELGTSKEELQSTNEELATVNSELQDKVDELSQSNSDLNNLLAGTEIGTVFLDNDLRVKRFSAPATKIFNLIESDLGRPIRDITISVPLENIYSDINDVLKTLNRKEIEIRTREGELLCMRVLPYRTLENTIEGVVITFVDVTRIEKAEESVRRLATVVTDSYDAITRCTATPRLKRWV
jgi:two-component system CheB/CheR fusion protein